MSTPRSTIPEPHRASPLRALAAVTLVAVLIAAILVSILAWKAIDTIDRADRTLTKSDRVADDAAVAIRRLNRNSNELTPALRELRRAARSVESLGGGATP